LPNTETIQWSDIRRIATLGEALLELRGAEDGQIHVAIGGDVANTAVCLGRILPAAAFEVSIATALGDSSYSDWMRSKLNREKLQVRDPGVSGEPGIYGIPLDAERQTAFSYWRVQSAARQFLQAAQLHQFQELLGNLDLLVVTGITLALCSASSFEHFCEWAQLHRHRCRIVFDSNFRRSLWKSEAAAQERIGQFEAVASVIATGLDDERMLWGANSAREIAERIAPLGAEYVIRGGKEGCWIGNNRHAEHVAALPVDVISTAGAGDSHLAGYVAARVSGRTPAEAAHYANRVAAVIVGQLGSMPTEGAVFPVLPSPSVL
jgi:2-dehydro-3-deoxygluconokinase